MGTKNNPDKFDCHAKAEPDEPIFTLLARDPVGAHLVSIWSKLRVCDYEAASRVFDDLVLKHAQGFRQMERRDVDKSAAAMQCSLDMFAWIKANRPERAL